MLRSGPAFALLALIAACINEPSYEGRICDDLSSCPEGYQCVERRCTRGNGEPPDGPVALDGGTGRIDAGFDVPTPIPHGPHARTLSGSGRLTAGTKTLDVEIGHPVDQRATGSGSRELKGTMVPR